MLNTDYREVEGRASRTAAMIYTGPIDEFFDFRYGKLPYRSLALRARDARQGAVPAGRHGQLSERLRTTRASREFKHLTGQDAPDDDAWSTSTRAPKATPTTRCRGRRTRSSTSKYEALARRHARRVRSSAGSPPTDTTTWTRSWARRSRRSGGQRGRALRSGSPALKRDAGPGGPSIVRSAQRRSSTTQCPSMRVRCRRSSCGADWSARSTGSATISATSCAATGHRHRLERPRPARRRSASGRCAIRCSGSASRPTGPRRRTGAGPTSASRGCASSASSRSPAWSTTAAGRAAPACSIRRSRSCWPATPRAVAERYPWVEHYTPVNEPLTTARFSGLYGHWYPHARDDGAFLRALLQPVPGDRARDARDPRASTRPRNSCRPRTSARRHRTPAPRLSGGASRTSAAG